MNGFEPIHVIVNSTLIPDAPHEGITWQLNTPESNGMYLGCSRDGIVCPSLLRTSQKISDRTIGINKIPPPPMIEMREA